MDDAALAESPVVSLHGFGTLGMTRTNEDSAQFIRDLTQPNGADTRWTAKVDSVLGIQANVQFSASTEGVVQVVSRYHADSSYRPELAWAFLRHDFSPDFSLRVGRLGTEFYMLGDSRLVGYSNISVRPPADFYGSLVLSYIDGIDITATLPVASGLLKGKLFAGKAAEKEPYAPGILWDLQGSALLGGYLDFTSGPWQFRASYAQLQFNQEMPVDALTGMPYLSLVPGMAMANQRASFSSLGLVYDKGPLNIQFMLNQIKHDSPAYADSNAAYILGGYRVGALTPFLGVSRSLSDIDTLPVTGNPVLDGVTASLAAHSFTDRNTYTVGGRWDIQKNLALKAQVDWIRGQPSSIFLVKGTESGGWDGHMTVFSLALDFVF
ncbi:porin [Rhodoferax sp.]|uniref:porin n=1 Tax=Rhodoferax sp. TaxID=50421 RepID=UPI002843BD65|nr:porin [Rhodoferax sp.]MDR3369809.1 hypothetical protein [Rhodoferax sp.]